MEPREKGLLNWFAFLLLASALLVNVLVLMVTRQYYGSFGPAGKVVAWVVVAVSLAALGSLAWMIGRLYVRPAIETGRERLRGNA